MATKYVTTINDLKTFIYNPRCKVLFQRLNLTAVRKIPGGLMLGYDNTEFLEAERNKPENRMNYWYKPSLRRTGAFDITSDLLYEFLSAQMFTVEVTHEESEL
jgi:hypothetical protein